MAKQIGTTFIVLFFAFLLLHCAVLPALADGNNLSIYSIAFSYICQPYGYVCVIHNLIRQLILLFIVYLYMHVHVRVSIYVSDINVIEPWRWVKWRSWWDEENSTFVPSRRSQLGGCSLLSTLLEVGVLAWRILRWPPSMPLHPQLIRWLVPTSMLWIDRSWCKSTAIYNYMR